MSLPFENDTRSFVKKIAAKEIRQNRTKTILSILTIVLSTSLIMALMMFESGYNVAKDRLASGQPQVVFQQLTDEQVKKIQSDEAIESAHTVETPNGYDVEATITDATQMTQYSFSTAVDEITSKYNISHAIKNEVFLDSLPDGGLLNQENMALLGISVAIILVSILVIYNIFYLSIVNQVRQFGQFRTIGMTQKQIKRLIKQESKLLCRISIPVGIVLGGGIGYCLQPAGWDWRHAIVSALLVTLIIYLSVKVSLSKPIKVAAATSPISSLKYQTSVGSVISTKKLKRNLSSFGIAVIGIQSNWKKVVVAVVTLGLSGLLFLLAAIYINSINAEIIVEKGIYQYGQFVLEANIQYADDMQMIDDVIQSIDSISGVNQVKQITKTDIQWSGKNNSGEDTLSVISAADFDDISPFIISGTSDYQSLVQANQVLLVNGMEGFSIGDTVKFQFQDGTNKAVSIGGILDGNIYTDTAIYVGWFLIPQELMQSDVIDPVAHIQLIVSGDEAEQQNIENNLNLILEQYPGFKLKTIQEAIASKNASIREVSAAIIGITLFLILFSIITFISTIITNLATRKQEFAMLQSIGMEREQIIKMAIFESSLLAFGSLLITLIFGTILGRIMVSILKNIGVFYLSYSFPFAIFSLYVITIIMIIVAITFFTFRVLQKDTLVERLRMID